MSLAIGLVWAAVVTWLLIRAVLQFRAYRELSPSSPGDETQTVSVIVPMRNEESNIGNCARSLLGQTHPSDKLDLVVVDDGSEDASVEVAHRTAKGDPSFRLIQAGALPPGWTGKAHACWRGARESEGQWLCFVDADTVANPELLASAIRYADENGIDMLSLEPHQELGSFWERVILPAGMFMMAFFATDLRAINDPEDPDVAANGQFILIRRKVYEAVGGHAAVRAEISEDTALARCVKEARYHTFLMGAGRLIRVRMYTDLSGIWEGISKNAVNMVKSPASALRLSIIGLSFAWASFLLPLWAAADLISGEALLGPVLVIAASLAMICTHISGSRYFGIPLGYGLIYPLGYTMVTAIVLNSVRAYRRGQVSWKGRVYAPERAEQNAAGEVKPAGESESP